MKMCQEAGLRWRGGTLPFDDFATGSYLDGHQIECGFGDKRDKNLTHSPDGCHEVDGWKIVPFSEFEREETIGVIKRNGNTITVHMGDLHGTAKCSPDDQFDLYTGCELALRRALENEAPAYPEKFESGKRYKVSIRAYRRVYKDIPEWMSDNEGKEVNVVSPYVAICGSLIYISSWCEEITETEKPAEPEKPKYYNGKMVCVDNGGFSWWTVGKIYEYKDGVVTTDDGDKYPYTKNKPYKDAEDAKHPGCLYDNRHNPDVTMLEIKE